MRREEAHKVATLYNTLCDYESKRDKLAAIIKDGGTVRITGMDKKGPFVMTFDADDLEVQVRKLDNQIASLQAELTEL